MREFRMDADVVMAVTRDAVAVVELDHAHSAFSQSQRHQAASSEVTIAVSGASCRALLVDVERLQRLVLHAKSYFHRFNARFELRLAADPGEVGAVNLVEQVELALLLGRAEIVVADAIDELLGIPFVVGYKSALVRIGQERRGP